MLIAARHKTSDNLITMLKLFQWCETNQVKLQKFVILQLNEIPTSLGENANAK